MSIYLSPSNFFLNGYEYGREYHQLLPICCTIDNYFVPVFAGINGTYIHSGNKKAIIYNIFEDTSVQTLSIPRTTTRFITLIHSVKSRNLEYSEVDLDGNRISVKYGIMRHFVYYKEDDGTIVPLYSLCIGNNDIYTFDRANIDYSKFFVLVSNKLLLPKHKFIAARLKPLIKHFQEMGSQIIYSPDITQLCMKSGTFQNTFKTVDERKLFVRMIKERVGLYVPPLPEAEKPKVEIPTRESVADQFVQEQGATPVPPFPPESQWISPDQNTLDDLHTFTTTSSVVTDTDSSFTNTVSARERRNPTREAVISDAGVQDNTVISPSTHQRVQAGFIDRSAYPVTDVEAFIIDDTETPAPEPVAAQPTGPVPDPSILNDPNLLTNTSTNIAF